MTNITIKARREGDRIFAGHQLAGLPSCANARREYLSLPLRPGDDFALSEAPLRCDPAVAGGVLQSCALLVRVMARRNVAPPLEMRGLKMVEAVAGRRRAADLSACLR